MDTIEFYEDRIYIDGEEYCFDDASILVNFCIANLGSNEEVCQMITRRSGSTLLHTAIRCNNEKLGISTISNGAKINAQEKSGGKTPIMLAVEYKHFDLVKELLKANADISIVDNFGKNVMSSVYSQSKTIPPWLIEMFFEKLNPSVHYSIELIAQEMINARCTLHCAVLLNNSAILKILLENGYDDINSQRYDCSDFTWFCSNTPLHIAVAYEKFESVKTLVQYGADVNKGNYKGAIPLTMYKCANVTSENLEILKILLDAGTLLTACHSGGTMQMSYILKDGNQKAINLLLQYNVDLFAQDKFGDTALHYLVLNTNPRAIEELRGKQFKVDILNTDGKSPLHIAAELGKVNAVQFLLDNGADVNLVDCEDGFTPLFLSLSLHAPESQLKKCIRLLIAYGADINFVSESQETIFDIVLRHKKPAIFRPVLAYLVALRIRSKSKISLLVLRQVLSHDYFKKYFYYYLRQLKQIKLTFPELFTLLLRLIVGTDDNVVRFAQSKESALKMLRVINRLSPKCCYTHILKKRLIKAMRIAKLRRKAYPSLFKIIGINFNHILANNISAYLNRDDLQALSRVYEPVDKHVDPINSD